MHFAEFLNEGFLAHLRILSLPTCVGFSTGCSSLVRSFSRQPFRVIQFRLLLPYLSALNLCRTHFTILRLTALDALFHPDATLLHCVTPSSYNLNRYWIVYQLSFAFAFRYCLGPDCPWVDERCPGSLRLPVRKFLTYVFATHTGILSSYQSTESFNSPSSQ